MMTAAVIKMASECDADAGTTKRIRHSSQPWLASDAEAIALTEPGMLCAMRLHSADQFSAQATRN